MKFEKAYFMISLDTEMHWGYNSYPNSKQFRLFKERQNEFQIIYQKFLKLFEKYKIPATWAIVGRIFQDNPEIIHFIKNNKMNHEIAYHSFSHTNFSKCDNKKAVDEIEHGMRISEEFGISFKSFVFPENLVDHIDILKKYGYSIFRGPNYPYKNREKIFPIRALKFFSYKFISPPVLPIWRDGIWEIPTSMVFYDPILPNTLELRANMGIKKAIKENKIFHIYLHPEDFLINKSLFIRLERIFSFLNKEESNIKPIKMEELASILNF